MSTTCDRSSHPLQYRAMVYSSQEELLDILAARTRGRVDAQDPVLVAVDPVSEKQLRELLGDEADTVEFVDPEALSGRTAGRVIRRFMTTARHAAATGPVSVLVQHTGHGADVPITDRPITDGPVDGEAWLRLECEVNATVECIPIDLVRLYDVESSACAILDNTRVDDASHHTGADLPPTSSDSPEQAPDLGGAYDVHWFDQFNSSALRGWLYFHSAVSGLAENTADEFVLAVHEAATAACRAANGTGKIRITGPAPLGGSQPQQQRVPVRIWPWLRQVTCEIALPTTLRRLEDRGAHTDPVLSALWTADDTCANVHVDVHRDAPSSGCRIRVRADRPELESTSETSATTPDHESSRG